jgi:hypothetical protein
VHSRAPEPRSTTAPSPAPIAAPVQLRLGENPAQLLHRIRAARAAVRGAGRYHVEALDVFTELATHANAEGVALVSAAGLALALDMQTTNVRRALRALAAGGFVIPLERAEGVLVAATRHPRHRVGYAVPGMVAPAPGRPQIVR